MKGDFSARIDIDLRGEGLELKCLVNAMAERIETVATELMRVSNEVGVRGRLGHQAKVGEAVGEWRELIGSVRCLPLPLHAQRVLTMQ